MLITLRQLQYAVAVADTGSFSKAAEVCFADQSTVSQQVKLLEDRLGVQIFRRERYPLKLSFEGDEIIHQARTILSQVEELVRPFKEDIKKK
jgi:LysR family hydrogen peroxide-inducible transcriptional activator